MLDREQYLLAKLVEEAAEVQQRALKMMQFGMNEIQAGQKLNNSQRLRLEIMDFLTIVDLMETEIYIDDLEAEGLHSAMKRVKMAEYLELSRKLGRVE